MERHRRDLEPEPDQHQQHRHDHGGVSGQIGAGGGDLGEADTAGETEDERHPVQHQGGGEHPQHVVLEGGLVGPDVALAPPGEQEQGAGGELEADEEDDQVASGGHHHRAEQRGQHQQVVLALVVAVRLDVGDRHEQDQVGAHDQEALEDEGEAVDHVGAAEHRPGLALDSEQDQRHRRQRHPRHRQRGHPVLPLPGQEEVEREHRQQRRHHHQLRGDGEIVDGHGSRPPVSGFRGIIPAPPSRTHPRRPCRPAR